MSTNAYTFDRSGDFPQNKNTLRHGAVSSLPTKEKSNPVVPPAAVASGKSEVRVKKATNVLRFRRMEPLSPADTFREASKKWLKNYEQHIEPRTRRDYKQYADALASFFGSITLEEIDHNLIATYQHWRSNKTVDEPEPEGLPAEQREPAHLKESPYRHGAGHSRINGEINSVLKQIMRQIGRWKAIAENYRSLPVSKLGSGRSLKTEDREKLIRYCFVKPRWRLAAHCIRLMFRLGAGPSELFNIRRRDMDVESSSPTVTILDGAKCEGDRERTLPLKDSSLESARWIIDRWTALGGTGDEQFILPHRANSHDGPTDFSRPMGSIKKAYAGIKDYVQEKDPQFYRLIKDFRLYDCRVTAVTHALKSGKVSIHTAKKYFGHVSEAMQRRYYKPHLDTLADVTRVLEMSA